MHVIYIPSIESKPKQTLVNLLDLSLTFIDLIEAPYEIKFNSIDQLKIQITNDKAAAKKYFDEMKNYFDLRQNAIQLAMSKVD